MNVKQNKNFKDVRTTNTCIHMDEIRKALGTKHTQESRFANRLSVAMKHDYNPGTDEVYEEPDAGVVLHGVDNIFGTLTKQETDD